MRWIALLALLVALSASSLVGCKGDGAKGFMSPDGKCTDGSTADCVARCECKTLGRCKRDGDKCVEVSNEACKASELCKTMGGCSFVQGRCAPGSDADCAQSDFCRIAQDCSLVDGRCAKSPGAATSASASAK